MMGTDLEIKGGGQEPYLVKAELHTRSARTTRVQGEDTIFIVTSDDYRSPALIDSGIGVRSDGR